MLILKSLIYNGYFSVESIEQLLKTEYDIQNDVKSIESAIDVLNNFKTRRVAILGDILETGSYNEEIHKNIGAYLPKKIDFLIAVGPSSKYIIDEAIKQGFNKDNIVHFDAYENLLTNITKLLQKNDTVLVKASHGIKLYEVVEYLNKFYE